MHCRHTKTMSEILQQQETAANVQARNQASLNQTMRERLALAMDKSLPFDVECGKGACVISRTIKREDVGADRHIMCFEKAQTSVKFFKDIILKEVVSVGFSDIGKLIDIAKHIGLISVLTKFSAPDITTVEGEITVQFPLKEIHGEVKQTNARFTLSGCKEIKYTREHCTLLHGTDLENNAVFLRWTVNDNAADDELKPDVSECVIVFNRSHKLNISTVLLPSVEDAQVKKVRTVLLDGYRNLYKATPVTIDPGVMFEVDKHDATLFFLRRNFPAKRYVKSSGSDQGIINENDIATQEAHIRKCTWEIVHLHWVYEALFSVARSISVKSSLPIKISTALLQHDDMLLAIAGMAAHVTKLFVALKTAGKHHLANLISPYNATLEGLISDKYNSDAYFGYKLTQWLLTTVEKCTMLIPFHDASTPRSSNFRAQLKRVNCALSRSAIRTTYTTDVLLALTRKSFIDPWGVIYEKVENLPEKLKTYSLVDIVKNAGWAVKDTIQDKQVSVVLDSTHMVRFTFHAFRRDFHGLNPVAASKAMRNAVSKPRKFKKSRQPSSDSNNKRSRDAIKKALQPARGLQKSMLLNPNNNIGANTSSATGPFVFGATTGPYSWSAH